MSVSRTRSDSRPATLAVRPALADHLVQGRAVLPAVEALQFLAREARERLGRTDVRRARDAEFLRFLELPPGAASVDAFVESHPSPDGAVVLSLVTRSTAGGSGVVRAREHIRVTLGGGPDPSPLALDRAVPEGPLFSVDPARLYAELVPFGPAYRNAVEPILLGADGAVARLVAPDETPGFPPLGSPYPLDAAFHVACAWGQRHRGQVLFPAGFASRHVLQPIAPGTPTFCRIVPISQGADHAVFDIRIWDEAGEPCEIVTGVRMADLFHGTVAVPEWIVAPAGPADPLAPLRAACAGLVVVELAALPPFAARLFSDRERARFADLGPDRGRSFTTARVALKRLARRLYSRAATAPAEALETVWPDGTHPTVELAGLPDGLHHFAAAHDERFAVAVAGDGPIGIDVEPLSARALRGLRMFASEEEQRRIRECGLEPEEAALLVWTAKEAAAKARDVPLASAWRLSDVRAIGPERSEIVVDGVAAVAHHARVEGHIFTLLSLPG
jgi:phosphopantetheinyl transferase